jgi:hypothetical protein
MTDYSDLVHRLRAFRPVYGWPEERAVTPTPTLGEQAAAALEAQAKEIAGSKEWAAKVEDANDWLIERNRTLEARIAELTAALNPVIEELISATS